MKNDLAITALESNLRTVGAQLGLLTRIDWALADGKDVQALVGELTRSLSGEMASIEYALRTARNAG